MDHSSTLQRRLRQFFIEIIRSCDRESHCIANTDGLLIAGCIHIYQALYAKATMIRAVRSSSVSTDKQGLRRGATKKKSKGLWSGEARENAYRA